MSKKKAKSLFTVLIAAVCMITMTFTFSTEESFAGGYYPIIYSKATSKKAGEITLKMYWNLSAKERNVFKLKEINDKGNNEWTYVIYQKKGNGAYKKIKALKKLPKTYTIKGLKKNVEYSYKVGCKIHGMTEKITKKVILENTMETTAVTKDSTKHKNVSKIKLSRKSMTLNYGTSKKLKATLAPSSKKVSSKVNWYVGESDDGIIKVDKNGKVTALYTGTGYVYAVSHNGVVAKCKVTVKNPKKKKMGFTYKVLANGVKIIPRKNNPVLYINCNIKDANGEYYDDVDGYYDDIYWLEKVNGKYRDFIVKPKKGHTVIVEAYILGRSKPIQKYSYTGK